MDSRRRVSRGVKKNGLISASGIFPNRKDMRTSDLSMEMAITEAKRIYKEGRDELKEEAK